MSEAIIIALIGIIPSLLIALATIISNNEIIKKRLDYLEKVASEYHHYEDKLREIRKEVIECQSEYLELKKDVIDLKDKNK